jgi:hypothetical protein
MPNFELLHHKTGVFFLRIFAAKILRGFRMGKNRRIGAPAARAGRRPPNATPACAFVSHACNGTIDSNFCQALFEVKNGAITSSPPGRQRDQQQPHQHPELLPPFRQ